MHRAGRRRTAQATIYPAAGPERGRPTACRRATTSCAPPPPRPTAPTAGSGARCCWSGAPAWSPRARAATCWSGPPTWAAASRVPNYPLRVEQWRQGDTAGGRSAGAPAPTASGGSSWTRRTTRHDRASGASSRAMLAFVTTGWSNNISPYDFGGRAHHGPQATRAALYTDRPIYRPAQTVYFRGIYRLDDDAAYSLPAGRGHGATACATPTAHAGPDQRSTPARPRCRRRARLTASSSCPPMRPSAPIPCASPRPARTPATTIARRRPRSASTCRSTASPTSRSM